MAKIKATSLVIDYNLYPRGDVDSQNIHYLTRALEAGHKLPPIVVERKTKRIVDGVHRWHAHRKFSGKDDVEIECIQKDYRNEKEFFLDAARYNNAHGVQLTTFDRVKCVIKAKELKISNKDIADALAITPKQLVKISEERIGRVRIWREGDKPSPEVPLKRTIKHMAGKALTQKQMGYNDKLSGMNPSFYINQLLMLIDGDLVDMADEELMKKLDELQKAIRGMGVKA
jgi:hypothetical protein